MAKEWHSFPKFGQNAVEKGKERYGATDQPYAELERMVPHPYATQNEGENSYHFGSQEESSMDHWGGKAEAKAQQSNPTHESMHIWSKSEVDKGMDDSKDISLHDDLTAHNAYPGVEKIENPGDVDEGKWKDAKTAAEKEYGPGHWSVVSHIYKSMGGKFHKKS